MPDREKTIKRLEHLSEWLFHLYQVVCDGDAPDYYDAYKTIDDAIDLLKEQKAERSDWISVNERMPVELHSIFWPWYGKKQWSNAMWREQSDKVLVTIAFKDGTRIVSTGETHDGVWHTAISKTLDPIVTHWMQFPEPPMEENE